MLISKSPSAAIIAGCVALCVGVLAAPALAQDSELKGVDPVFSELIARCAPTVHPETMAAVISAESRGHQFAIADAGPVKLPWAQRKLLVRSYYPDSLATAVAKAQELIANGHTVSLGFAQVNDRNLAKLGLSLSDVFEPCSNLAAGGRILTEFYEKAARKFGPGTSALRAAISAYNSGDWVRGEKDGYVDLVYRQVGRPLAMRTGPVVPRIKQAQVSTSGKANTIGKPQRKLAMTASEFVVSE